MERLKIVCGTCLILLLCGMVSRAQNSQNKNMIIPGIEWKDTNKNRINAHGGGMLYENGTYYWYGEHKIPGRSEDDKAGGGVHCYSSTDLYNWKDEGVVLSVDYDDPDSEVAFGCILERPKVIYNEITSKYMMYFKLYPKGQGYKYGYLGVATAHSPNGPFTYSHRFLAADSEEGSGDFALFRDADGTVYHFTVRKPDKAFVVGKLNKEYTYPDGAYRVMEEIPPHTEAPAIFLKDNRYFMLGSGSTGWNPNTARAFTAASLLGPYKELGNPTKGVNPHNDMNEEKTFGGQSSYIIKVEGKKNAFIAMFDVWKPEHPFDGLYVWLPIEVAGDTFKIEWRDKWDLSFFDK